MSEEIRDAVVSIVHSMTLRNINVSDDASLFHDLGIAGDDAAELIDRLYEKFGTRFDGLEFSKFFPNESEALFYHVIRLFGYRSRKPELTLRHLVRVVENGAWVTPNDTVAPASK